MLRISKKDTHTGPLLLRLEGSLRGPWVAELRRVADDALARDGGLRVVVDVADLLFVDAAGLALLRNLIARGARVRNGSPFLTEQLGDPAHGD